MYAHAAGTTTVPSIGQSELSKEIQAEKIRIVQLTKTLQPTSGIARTLRNGSSGKDVRLLQDFLALYGTFSTTTARSNYFGPQTAQAVKEFQRKESLEPAGVVGPKTRARIRALSNRELVQAKVRTASSSPEALPEITEVIFSREVGEDGSGVGSATVFATTTKNIYAILSLANAKQDTAVGLVRYYNDVYVDSAVTHPSRSGLRYLHVQWALKPDAVRTPGTYTVTFYVNGKKSKTATYSIR
jgi:peptidoglycan hydrolase-like protein with peptidoglycan-binding domain